MEKFILKINASKEENEKEIGCHVECDISCDAAMAVSTINNVFKDQPKLKEMFKMALFMEALENNEDLDDEEEDDDDDDDQKNMFL